MSPTAAFAEREQERAVLWKARTGTLPDQARVPAPYVRDGNAQGLYEYCLPAEFAAHNLLPPVRAQALATFARDEIVWHQAIDGGPTNHLLSSQVQCVNALAAASWEPERLVAAFADVLDIAEPLPVGGDEYLSFEYIGAVDHLGEGKGPPRTRGSMVTSADAAFRYRTSAGQVEVALVEWKYTEQYLGQELRPPRGASRADRYRPLWDDSTSPIRRDVLPYEDVFVEPIYQLFRQQLLAWRMETTEELGATTVRVIHISPSANVGLRESLNRPSHLKVSSDVLDVWRAMLQQPDRFVSLDSGRFVDPKVTNADYVERYGGD